MLLLNDPVVWLGPVLGAASAVAIVKAGLWFALLQEKAWLKLGLFAYLAGLTTLQVHLVLSTTPTFAAAFLIGAASGTVGTWLIHRPRVPQPRRDPQAVVWTSPVRFFKPNACRGCKHYYGLGHGRDLLICAMHPYGPEADLCEDREALGLD